ncbi:hypothetical protein ACTQ5J_07440 [Fundicoccus sp. Sow4_F4]|uniref:hypothetical protein n=1 Tax=Fundicoccus sp. Sow4_F4 TaxID=3438783 RepID=UPI003F927D6D
MNELILVWEKKRPHSKHKGVTLCVRDDFIKTAKLKIVLACQYIYGGKSCSEWKKLKELKESETQPLGGAEPEKADNEVLLDGVVYIIKKQDDVYTT